MGASGQTCTDLAVDETACRSRIDCAYGDMQSCRTGCAYVTDNDGCTLRSDCYQMTNVSVTTSGVCASIFNPTTRYKLYSDRLTIGSNLATMTMGSPTYFGTFFRVDSNITVTHVRFYKVGGTPTVVTSRRVEIWDFTNLKALAVVITAAEPDTTGWIEVPLAQPLTIPTRYDTTEYVVFTVTLEASVHNGQLHVQADERHGVVITSAGMSQPNLVGLVRYTEDSFHVDMVYTSTFSACAHTDANSCVLDTHRQCSWINGACHVGCSTYTDNGACTSEHWRTCHWDSGQCVDGPRCPLGDGNKDYCSTLGPSTCSYVASTGKCSYNTASCSAEMDPLICAASAQNGTLACAFVGGVCRVDSCSSYTDNSVCTSEQWHKCHWESGQCVDGPRCPLGDGNSAYCSTLGPSTCSYVASTGKCSYATTSCSTQVDPLICATSAQNGTLACAVVEGSCRVDACSSYMDNNVCTSEQWQRCHWDSGQCVDGPRCPLGNGNKDYCSTLGPSTCSYVASTGKCSYATTSCSAEMDPTICSASAQNGTLACAFVDGACRVDSCSSYTDNSVCTSEQWHKCHWESGQCVDGPRCPLGDGNSGYCSTLGPSTCSYVASTGKCSYATTSCSTQVDPLICATSAQNGTLACAVVEGSCRVDACSSYMKNGVCTSEQWHRCHWDSGQCVDGPRCPLGDGNKDYCFTLGPSTCSYIASTGKCSYATTSCSTQVDPLICAASAQNGTLACAVVEGSCRVDACSSYMDNNVCTSEQWHRCHWDSGQCVDGPRCPLGDGNSAYCSTLGPSTCSYIASTGKCLYTTTSCSTQMDPAICATSAQNGTLACAFNGSVCYAAAVPPVASDSSTGSVADSSTGAVGPIGDGGNGNNYTLYATRDNLSASLNQTFGNATRRIGVQFRVQLPIVIRSVRYFNERAGYLEPRTVYVSSRQTADHPIRGQVTVPNGTFARGWIEARLDTPIVCRAGVFYVVWYSPGASFDVYALNINDVNPINRVSNVFQARSESTQTPIASIALVSDQTYRVDIVYSAACTHTVESVCAADPVCSWDTGVGACTTGCPAIHDAPTCGTTFRTTCRWENNVCKTGPVCSVYDQSALCASDRCRREAPSLCQIGPTCALGDGNNATCVLLGSQCAYDAATTRCTYMQSCFSTRSNSTCAATVQPNGATCKFEAGVCIANCSSISSSTTCNTQFRCGFIAGMCVDKPRVLSCGVHNGNSAACLSFPNYCAWNASTTVCSSVGVCPVGSQSLCESTPHYCNWDAGTCRLGASCPIGNRNPSMCTALQCTGGTDTCFYNSPTCATVRSQAACNVTKDAIGRTCQFNTTSTGTGNSTGVCALKPVVCPSLVGISNCSTSFDSCHWDGSVCRTGVSCLGLTSQQCALVPGQCVRNTANGVCLHIGMCANATPLMCSRTRDAQSVDYGLMCISPNGVCTRQCGSLVGASQCATQSECYLNAQGLCRFGTAPVTTTERAGSFYPVHTSVAFERSQIDATVGMAFKCMANGVIDSLFFYRIAGTIVADTRIGVYAVPDANFGDAGTSTPTTLMVEEVARAGGFGWIRVGIRPLRVFSGRTYIVAYRATGGGVPEQRFGQAPEPLAGPYTRVVGSAHMKPPSSPPPEGPYDSRPRFNGPYDINWYVDVNFTMSTTVEAWEPPPTLPVATQNTTATIVVDGGGIYITDEAAYAEQLAFEMRVITNSTSPIVVDTVRFTGGMVYINVTMGLTAAQVLQQFISLYTTEAVTLDAGEYPIIGRTTQIVVYDPPPVPSYAMSADSNTYDSTCGIMGSNCAAISTSIVTRALFTPVCVGGLCGCAVQADGSCVLNSLSVYVPPGEVACVSGVTLPGEAQFPDVCQSRQSTLDALVYRTTTHVPVFGLDPATGATLVVSTTPVNVSDECAYRDPRSRNIFPRRRFCQSRDYNYPLGETQLTGVFGDLRNASSPARVFSLSMEFWREYALSPSQYDVVKVVDGYVSNLYDGGEPIHSKVWARIEYVRLFSNTSVQLTRLTFLDAVEGAADRYYANGAWQYIDCAALGWSGKSYGVANGTCACQLHHEHNPYTSACEPGCVGGAWGSRCERSGGCSYTFNNRTLFLRAGDCSAVCAPGSESIAGECTAVDPVRPDDALARGEPSSSSSTVDISVADIVGIVLASVGVVAGGSILAVQLYKYRVGIKGLKPKMPDRSQYTSSSGSVRSSVKGSARKPLVRSKFSLN